MVTSFLYELPGAQERRGQEHSGGWELGSIFTLQEGGPFHVDAGRDRSLTAVRHDRSQIVGNPHLPSNRTRGERLFEWFNKEGLRPCSRRIVRATRGRNNLARDRGLVNLDVSLRKRITIAEGHSLDFRVDFFNLPNKPNFGTPRRGSATDRRLGRITGARAGRIGQFSLKYSF